GRAKIRGAIADGSGLAAFRRLIEAQHGDPRVVDDLELLPRAPHVIEVRAPRAGWIAGLHAEEAGLASVMLGAGRARKEDAIDPAVGFALERRRGDRVEAGETIAFAHVRDPEAAAPAVARFLAAWEVADEAPAPRPLFIERIG